MIAIGEKAPDFTLDGVVGKGDATRASLADLRGKWVVLFFYSKDFSAVCPTEVKEFSRRHDEFERLRAVVLGVSCDSALAHRAWIQHELGEVRYPLLSDMGGRVARSYGVYQEDKGFPVRGTFIVDPEGTLVYATLGIPRIGRSVEEVLRVLQALQTGEICPVDWKPGQKTLGK